MTRSITSETEYTGLCAYERLTRFQNEGWVVDDVRNPDGNNRKSNQHR